MLGDMRFLLADRCKDSFQSKTWWVHQRSSNLQRHNFQAREQDQALFEVQKLKEGPRVNR